MATVVYNQECIFPTPFDQPRDTFIDSHNRLQARDFELLHVEMIHVRKDMFQLVDLSINAEVIVFPGEKQHNNTRVSDFITRWQRCPNCILEISSETFHRGMVFCVRYVVSSRTGKTNEAIGGRLNDTSLNIVSKL
jgi:hypothetical protein